MATAVPHDQRSRGVGGRRRRVPRTLWVLACFGAALLAGYQLFVLLQPPGDAIGSELEAAAAEMRTEMVPKPSPAVLAAMRRDFSGQDVSIATTPRSPVVAVTLHGLDRETCLRRRPRRDGSTARSS